ncbi:MAG: hypothetical protein ACRD2A_13215 [Vicinamibacterales bacterium]
MKREISCKLDGANVVQTTSVYGDGGRLQQETVITLGDRDVVLGQIEESLAEAKRDLDGMTAPEVAKPTPAATGRPGVEVKFWKNGDQMYRCEVRRGQDGKVQSHRIEHLGHASQRLANADERHAEIKDVRDKIAAAK